MIFKQPEMEKNKLYIFVNISLFNSSSTSYAIKNLGKK